MSDEYCLCPFPCSCSDCLIGDIAEFIIGDPDSPFCPVLARIANHLLDQVPPPHAGFVSVTFVSKGNMTTTLKLTLLPRTVGGTTDITAVVDGTPLTQPTGPDGTVNFDFADTATAISVFGNEITAVGRRSDDGPSTVITLTDYDKPAAPGAVGVSFVSQS